MFDTEPQGPIYAGETWTYTPNANDPEGGNVTLTLVEPAVLPEGLTFEYDVVTEKDVLIWNPTAEGGIDITIAADDHVDGVTTQQFRIEAVVRNVPPEITSEPDVSIHVGDYWSYQIVAGDANRDSLEYTHEAPTAVGLERRTGGQLVWTPTEVGEYDVAVTVADGRGGVATQTFTIAVENRAPEFTTEPTGPVYVGGDPWTYPVEAVDPDGHTPSYFLEQPATVPGVIELVDGVLRWSPAETGTIDVVLRVEDGHGGVVRQSFKAVAMDGTPSDGAPVIRSLPPTPARAGLLYDYPVDAYDPEGTMLTYRLDKAPAGMHIDPDGRLAWEPQVANEVGHEIVIIVADGDGESTSQTYTLPVLPHVAPNEPPNFTSTPLGPAVKDLLYRYDVDADDPNGDAVTFSFDPEMTVISGMSVDADTGVFTWDTPQTGGTVTIIIRAADDRGAFTTHRFDLPVLDNAPPEITSPAPDTVNRLNSLNHTVTADDPNPDDISGLKFSLARGPVGAELDEDTGVLT